MIWHLIPWIRATLRKYPSEKQGSLDPGLTFRGDLARMKAHFIGDAGRSFGMSDKILREVVIKDGCIALLRSLSNLETTTREQI